MVRDLMSALMLSSVLLLCGCGGGQSTADGPAVDGPGSDESTGGPAGFDVSRLGTPESSIAYQFELLKAGDVENLKSCITGRLQSRVTAESLAEGKENLEQDGLTLEKLVGPIEMGEYEGNKTAKIMMPGGSRWLTTLVQTNGKWLADTIWWQ